MARFDGTVDGDTIKGTNSADEIYGGGGNDTLNGLGGDDLIEGEDGDDIVEGDAGDDTLSGGESNDIVNGGAGRDAMSGGGGNDVFLVDDSGDTVIEGVDQGRDTVLSSISFTLPANVERLAAYDEGGLAALNFIGNGIDNEITGTGGPNVLNGGAGADLMIGGGGNDTYFVDNSGDTVSEAPAGGYDAILTDVSYTITSSVELLRARDAAATTAISLIGDAASNRLIGNAGANVLDGGAGGDAMVGLGGDDIYYVDNPNDEVVETRGGGFDTVFASSDYRLVDNIERIVAANLASTAALSFRGNDSNNEMTGNAGANILDGRGAADLMVGGAGDDIYVVENAGDAVFEAAAGGIDTVYTSVSFTLGSEVERPVSNTGSGVNATGNELANEISGGGIIDGKGGSDILTGRLGANAFAFTTVLGPGNIDALTDFAVGQDKIYLDDAIFSALAGGALPAEAFAIGSAAADANDRIVYDPVTGALYYDADGSGGSEAIQFAVVHEGLGLTASDFYVI
jgi:Ca2+-binding RTX toxin-like protein